MSRTSLSSPALGSEPQRPARSRPRSYGGEKHCSTEQLPSAYQPRFELYPGKALCYRRPVGDEGFGMIATDGILEIVLRNDLGAADRLAAAVLGFCHDQDGPPRAAYHLNLVLDELMTNIVSYGYDEGNGRQEIRIRLRREPSAVQVQVEDDGRSFNPLEVPPPDLDAPVETRPIGGLGIHFLRTLMDDLCYRRENERNRLCFKKLLPQEGTAA